MKYALFLAAFVLFTSSAAAQRQRYCDGHEPYYHDTANGPGAAIADIFFLPGTLSVGVVAAGVTGDAHALCGAAAHARNIVIKKRKAQRIKDQRQNGNLGW